VIGIHVLDVEGAVAHAQLASEQEV
jgi:hypothetical protein